MDVLLYPQTPLGTVARAHVTSLPEGITEVKGVSAVVSSQVIMAAQDPLEAVDLSSLSSSEQAQVKDLLYKYRSVFATHKGDLGSTNLIAHEIPLLVHQHYRHIPRGI